MTWLKTKLHNAWLHLKKWGIAVLATLGIIVGGVIYAQPVTWSWTNATQREDGSIFDPATELAETQLYCDGDDVNSVAATAGADTAVIVEQAIGRHDCYAVHVDIYGLTSARSAVKTKIVIPASPPGPPILDDPV